MSPLPSSSRDMLHDNRGCFERLTHMRQPFFIFGRRHENSFQAKKIPPERLAQAGKGEEIIFYRSAAGWARLYNQRKNRLSEGECHR